MIMASSNNTAPTYAQDHGGDVRASSDLPKGPVRLTNDSEREQCAVATQTKSLHPATVVPRRRPDLSSFRNGSGRRSSFERNNFRSSLQTIESRASSLDIFEEDDDDSNMRGSVHSGSTTSVARPLRRRYSLDMAGSSTNSLMVSFSKLSEQELSHLRKWNRRLQRTEVFDKYYFPAKWEANEMEALVGFLNLEDPSSKLGGGMRGGSLQGGGAKGGKSALSESGVGVRRGRLTGNTSSWQSGDSATAGESGGLSSSLTSTLKSAGKLSKLLTDPIKNTADPSKLTRKALNSIFFPYIHDPKSVLLKRGSLFLHETSLPNERELMIFTHGFLLANVVLKDAFSLFLALSDREFLTEKSFLDYLQNRFKEMDEEDTGEIEKWELQKLFTDMGIPMGESVLDELIQRSILATESVEHVERVDWGALHNALQGFFAHKNYSASPSTNTGLDDSEHSHSHGLTKLFDRFQKRKTTKVEYASLFSNVARVDSLDICHGEDAIATKIANSVYAQTSFSVTLNDRKNDPFIFVCCKPEHRDSWVDAFKPGVFHAFSKSSVKGATELRSKLGWQHLVIRSSFVSLVILNEYKALERALKQDTLGGISHRKFRLEINLLDEHNGYSPLHYATILGHTYCMVALLEAGAKVNMEDKEGLSPMYHALSLRNDEVANVLEKFGADRSDDLRKLIACEIEAAESKQTNGNDGLETHVEDSSLALDKSVASSSREDKFDQLLVQAASRLGALS